MNLRCLMRTRKTFYYIEICALLCVKSICSTILTCIMRIYLIVDNKYQRILCESNIVMHLPV